eukprot:SAG31_NODE_1160_length_9602_cov_20.626434_12_plen_73_part_00
MKSHQHLQMYRHVKYVPRRYMRRYMRRYPGAVLLMLHSRPGTDGTKFSTGRLLRDRGVSTIRGYVGIGKPYF